MRYKFQSWGPFYHIIPLCVLSTWAAGILPKLAVELMVHSSSPPYAFRWQDIVIGAPQYFDRDGEVGGAVYVYMNQQGRWKNVKPIRLNGTKDSMFGIAVKNIGDINQDGYPGKIIDYEMIMICR